MVRFGRIVATSGPSSPSSSKLGLRHLFRSNFPVKLGFHHDSNQGKVGRRIVADGCRESIGQRTTGQRAKYQMPWTAEQRGKYQMPQDDPTSGSETERPIERSKLAPFTWACIAMGDEAAVSATSI